MGRGCGFMVGGMAYWGGLFGLGGWGEWWVAYGLWPKSRGRRTRASSFEVHPAGKFQ